MSDIEVSIDGAEELALAFELAPKEMAVSLFPVLDESGKKLRDDWRRGARKSARRHGRYYPASITQDLYRADGAMWADVGPDSSLPQGGMGRGFEYGSVNTPPHPDGAVAFSANMPKFYDAVSKRVDEVIREVLL